MTADRSRAYEEAVRVRLAAARLWAAHRAPYLASAVFALNPVILEPAAHDDTGAPVADPEFRAFPADTRWNLYVEPGTALATPVEEIGWWMLHQVGHLVRGHASRSPARPRPGREAAGAPARGEEAHRWNQAADAELNDDVVAEDLPGPAGVISPAELGLPAHRTAEEYVPMLDVLAEAMGRGGQALAEAIDCGSAVDGRERTYEDAGSAGGLTRLDRDLLERSIAAAAVRDRISGRGEVPAGWRRWAEERLRPSVNWRARLGAVIRSGLSTVAGQVDFSYRRPSRRAGAYAGVVPPSMVRAVPDTVLVVDTSGSVTGDVLNRLLAEVTGIIDGVAGPGRRLRAFCCDVRPYPVQVVRRAGDIALTGGGGTDMRAGLAAATALRPRPDLVVVLTDGRTAWPERRPAARVVVCLIGEGGHAPGWASVVRVPARVPVKGGA
ncbi:VWA-like domain-containing protein [Nonomuraea sp. MCN248]|uniref:VWA-like domain-containing protein n=1 Tax=Nonomuraea corallina TaxID=2989783 RepID=A0ABT4SJR3_9ACTN|nr:VWA-like domain-containing protein [Nonomuraea corallina]MDA0637230.1 VWA-like domain-containing protein [Nonomuraea corallina]